MVQNLEEGVPYLIIILKRWLVRPESSSLGCGGERWAEEGGLQNATSEPVQVSHA
jgi:hypothetical protein